MWGKPVAASCERSPPPVPAEYDPNATPVAWPFGEWGVRPLPDRGQARAARIRRRRDGPIVGRRATVDELDPVGVAEEAVERDRPRQRMAEGLETVQDGGRK